MKNDFGEPLLELQSGDLLAPSLIKRIVTFYLKGVGLFNAENELIAYIPEKDAGRQGLIVKRLKTVVNSGRSWTQPNWDVDLDTKSTDQKVSSLKIENKAS